MALPKAVRFTIVLLAIYCSLEHQGYKESLNVFFQELMGIKPSDSHAREKRVASLNSSEFLFQVVIYVSDLDRLRSLLSTDPSFIMLDGLVHVSSIVATTVCSSNELRYQCRCEGSLSWSHNNCITYGACDDIIGNTCGCINGLPADGQYCQLNSTPPVTETTLPQPTNETVNTDLLIDVHIQVSSIPPNVIGPVRSLSFPYTINQYLKVIDLNVTTVCYPNSSGGLQCQCEDQFAWSCDKCNEYGVCSNATTHTCGCINGLPSDGDMCTPKTSVSPCPTPTPEISKPMTTTPMTTTTPPPTTTTTLTTTTMQTTTTMTTIIPTTTTTMTTTMPTTTTTMTTTMPTPTTTTTTMPTTTTTTTGKPTANVVVTRSFAMDIKYNDAYNNPSHEVYINVDNAIKTQCKEHIRTLQSAEISEFRSGSTVVDYTITATTFGEGELEAVKVGIFTNLSRIYSMIFDSPTSLPFNPPFLGQKLSLTCGPIPAILNFTDSWTAEWRRNDEIILEDSLHSFAKQAKTATLTVLQFFTTDKGRYECKLKEKNVFKQQSKGEIIYKVLPIIQLKPMTVKIKCEAGKRVLVECSVNSPYMVEFKDLPVAGKGLEIDYEYSIDGCPSPERKFTCQEVNFPSFKKEITLKTSTEDFLCVSESVFGQGVLGDRAPGPCDPNEVGEKIAECQENGTWKVIEENCVLRQIYELLDQSTTLNNNSLAAFLDKLSNVTIEFDEEVAVSPANVNALVDTLNNVADKISSLNILVTEIYMEDILLTVGVLTTDGAKQSWDSLNTKSTTKSSVSSPTRSKIPKANNPSSSLLLSLETITSNLDNNSFEIATSSILLTKTTFKDTFNDDFNSSVEIHIPEADGGIKSITVLTFSSMDNVLPARDEDNSTSNVINGRVVLVKSGGTISNISFAFDVINNALRNPQCVFWNFSLFDGLGGWDGEGCQLILSVNQTVTCTCNHLTSFSILMSPYVPNSPVLDYITYIGVGISMASLVICLIIESIIWRKIRKNNTSYLRHVSIVNIAVSLLIANIWFIIGAAISDEDVKNPPACIAATFFIHFFYLALFFWMLASALLLLYRTISVFGGDLSKHSMLAIGFSLGYGAPLIIAIITIAVTAPSGAYIRDSGVCWLNWETSMALLAFVIPALTIVVINLGILLVVLYKMLRRRSVVDTAQAAEKNALAVIARALAFLTPFFGLTWGLGVGTMTAKEGQRLGVHIAFAFFNSLQGFFILLFGTLLDKKAALRQKMRHLEENKSSVLVLTEMALISQTSRSGTRSTSDGTSSSGWGIFRNWRRGRDGYNVSSNGDGSYHTNS